MLAVGLAIVAGAVVLALALRTERSEEKKIEDMLATFFDGFEEQDADKLAGVFSEECGDMTAAAEDAITQLYTGATEVSFELAGVDVRNLEDDTAEVLPEGNVTIDGERTPLAGEDEEYTPVVKEDGDWKIAACDLFA